MAPNIYWVGGGKGGVGKSMVSMALLDHLLERGVPALFVESSCSRLHGRHARVRAVENLPLGIRAEVRRWRAAVGKILAEVVDG